jgi:hypothetical protein
MFNRFILFAALLLAPASALAADQAPGGRQDGFEKDVCDQAGEDAVRCARLWRWCHWDSVDHKCERNPTGRCGQFYDKASCEATPGCIWDTEDPLGPRCESSGE